MTDSPVAKPTERELVIKAWRLVDDFFKGEGHKTNLWFRTPNPGLGGMSPYFMIYIGRIQKLIKFIETQLEGNHP